MSDQNSPSSPYEPPSRSTPADESGYEPPATGSGYEPPTSGSSYPPPSGPGSIYESAGYQPSGGQQPSGGEQPAGGPAAGGQVSPAYPVASGGRNNTTLFGILGIVLAVFCCAPLGILFGWLSMNEAKKTGSDDTLGKVGFWLGIALTAIGLVVGLIAICAGGLGSWDSNRY